MIDRVGARQGRVASLSKYGRRRDAGDNELGRNFGSSGDDDDGHSDGSFARPPKNGIQVTVFGDGSRRVQALAENYKRHVCPDAIKDRGRSSALSDKQLDSNVAGIIFLCDKYTHAESLRRGVFGVPYDYIREVELLCKGTPVFLYHTTKQVFYAGYVSTGKGDLNIERAAFGDLKAREHHQRHIAHRNGFRYHSKYGQWYNDHEDDSLFAAQVTVEQVDVFPPVAARRVKPLLSTGRENRLTSLGLDLGQLQELLELFMDAKEYEFGKRPRSFFSRFLDVPLDPTLAAAFRSGDSENDTSLAQDDEDDEDGAGGMSQPDVDAWINYLAGPPAKSDVKDGDCIVCHRPAVSLVMCNRHPCTKDCEPLCCVQCQRKWLHRFGDCLLCREPVPLRPPPPPPAMTPLAAEFGELGVGGKTPPEPTMSLTPLATGFGELAVGSEPETPPMTPLAAGFGDLAVSGSANGPSEDGGGGSVGSSSNSPPAGYALQQESAASSPRARTDARACMFWG